MRKKGFDLLRGIAILLVIFRHAGDENIFSEIGWAGVDLFFVLSGFLVSGILFKEFRDTGKINFKRFFIRRSFKIFPPFYFFIFVSVAVSFLFSVNLYRPDQVFNEIFYLQSYREGMWYHTWSLAVEEHFYILLAVLMYIGLKTGAINKIKFTLLCITGILLLSIFLRCYSSWIHRNDEFYSFTATHLRMDGILIGVLLSFLNIFTDLNKFVVKNKILYVLLAIILILPLFIFTGGSYDMNTAGITFVNIGFGVLVLLSVQEINQKIIIFPGLLKYLTTALCFIGIHSYSIYLWHLFSEKILHYFNVDEKYYFPLFVGISLLTGVILSFLIEKPFLKLRERLFSARN